MRVPGAEVHLQAFALESGLFLHTSPEFALKKLLAAGEERLMSLVHCYRRGESGPLHAPEFTMLEWYRAHAPYEAVQADALQICRLAAEAAGRDRLSWRGRECDPFAEAQALSVAQAFARYAGIDLIPTLGDVEKLRQAAKAAGFRAPIDETWSDLFSRLLTERIEPNLGIGRPTLLCEYPIEEAALACPLARDPRFAERFELYACGVELANGYGELTDPVEQRRRFREAADQKAARYGEAWPIDEELLVALPGMPQAAGCALGLDRLLVLATGAREIAQVQWTPFPET